MAYQPLTPVGKSNQSGSDVFAPEAYIPLVDQPKEYIQGLQSAIEDNSLTFASEPQKKDTWDKISSFFKPESDNPVTQETIQKEANARIQKQFKGLFKENLDKLPQFSNNVSNWINNIMIEKPAEFLANSDFRLFQRGENPPIIKDRPYRSIQPNVTRRASPATFFKEAADGIQYLSTERDLLGIEILKTAQFGTEALSSITRGFYKTKNAAPENISQKFFKTFSETVGFFGGIKLISSGLFSLSQKSSTYVKFMNTYPRFSKVATPLLINAGALTTFGQLNPELAGDFKARMKQMAFDAALSVPLTGIGLIKTLKLSIPASVGLGYGLTALSGGSQEDSILAGISFGVIDALLRTGGRGRHGFISGEQAEKIMRQQSADVLGVKENASLAEIKVAYRKLALKHSPDLGGSTQRMVEINNARDFLTSKSPSFQKQAEAEVKKAQNEKSKREIGIEIVEEKPKELIFGEKPIPEPAPKPVPEKPKPEVPEKKLGALKQSDEAKAELKKILQEDKSGEVDFKRLRVDAEALKEKEGSKLLEARHIRKAFEEQIKGAEASGDLLKSAIDDSRQLNENEIIVNADGEIPLPRLTDTESKGLGIPNEIFAIRGDIQHIVQRRTENADLVNQIPNIIQNHNVVSDGFQNNELQPNKKWFAKTNGKTTIVIVELQKEGDRFKLNSAFERDTRKFFKTLNKILASGGAASRIDSSRRAFPIVFLKGETRSERRISDLQRQISDQESTTINVPKGELPVKGGGGNSSKFLSVYDEFRGMDVGADIEDPTGTIQTAEITQNTVNRLGAQTNEVTLKRQPLKHIAEKPETFPRELVARIPEILREPNDVKISTHGKNRFVLVKEGKPKYQGVVVEVSGDGLTITVITTFKGKSKDFTKMSSAPTRGGSRITPTVTEANPPVKDGVDKSIGRKDKIDTPVKGGFNRTNLEILKKKVSGVTITDVTPKDFAPGAPAKSGNLISENTKLQERGSIQTYTENPVTLVNGKIINLPPRKVSIFRRKPFEGVPEDILNQIKIGGGTRLSNVDLARLGQSLIDLGYANKNTGIVVKGYVGRDVILGTTKTEEGMEYIVAGINEKTGKLESVRLHATTITNDQILGRTEITLNKIKESGLLGTGKADSKTAEESVKTQIIKSDDLSIPAKTAIQAEELTLRIADAPKEGEDKVFVEIKGKDVQRFTAISKEDAIGGGVPKTPILSKAKFKVLFTGEFAENPVLTVKEGQLVFEGKDSTFKINAKALGLVEDNLKNGQKIRVDIEQIKKAKSKEQQEFRVFGGGGSVEASKGMFREGEPIELGNFDKVRPIEFPELVSLARDLLGKFPEPKRLAGHKGGFFKGDPLNKRIVLNRSLFEAGNHRQLAATLAHEIGHLIDFLPDLTMKRGNLIGRLNTLHKFLKGTFGDKEVTNTELRKELKKVSFWWRPFDVDNLGQYPESYITYRNSSKELYADAISVLFNTPGTLERMAPKFYSEFFENIDKKPQVKKEFFDLQELLSKGEDVVLAEREQKVREMFRTGEDGWKIKQAERGEKAKSFSFKLKQELIDINQALIEKVNKIEKEGGYVNPDENPVFMLNAQNYVGGVTKAFMDTKIDPIYKDLADNGISWEDFGVYLFWTRIALGDRTELANPLGHTPETVQASIDKMKRDFGGEAFDVMEKNRVAFRDVLLEVTTEAYKSGLYKPELYEQMIKNPAYATFQVLDHLKTNIPASISHQVGTLKEVANPATASLMKIISTIRSTERNNSRKGTKDFLENNFPEEVKPAKTKFDGKRNVVVESFEPGEELLTYMEDGIVKGVYVDPYIVDSHRMNTVGVNKAIIQMFSIPNNAVFRPLMITYNVGFQTFNLKRDLVRTWKAAADETMWEVVKQYSYAIKPSIARGFGGQNDLITEMEGKKMLNFTYNDILLGRTDEDVQIDKIFREHGILKGEPVGVGTGRFPKLKKFPVLKQIATVLKWIEQLGNTIETLPKVASYQMLKGTMPEAELAEFIRTRVGSPDFFRRGKIYNVTNNLYLFSNAIKEGIRGDMVTAFKDPKTRSGYWWKTAKINFLPKILMFLAALGWFGDDLRKAMNNASEYDKTNYTIIPVANRDDGRSWYLRIPTDEVGRTLGGMMWKMLNIAFNEKSAGEDLVQIMSFTGGQLPSTNPMVKVVVATGFFLGGKNPYDTFRGRSVLSDDEFKAGGKYAVIPFLKWTTQQIGLGTIWRVRVREGTPQEKTALEKTLNAPLISNVLGRWIKVSNYGQTEKNREIITEIDSKKARARLEQRKIINDAVKKFQDGGSHQEDIGQIKKDATSEAFSGQIKTKAELRRFQKKIDIAIIRGQADPNINALISATSVDAQVALLEQYKKIMTKTDFDDLFDFVQKNKVISHSTAVKLREQLSKSK